MTPEELITQMESRMAVADWTGARELFVPHPTVVAANWKASWDAGWVCYKLGQLDEAFQHLSRAATLAPHEASALGAYGLVARDLGRDDEAERALTDSLAIREAYPWRLALSGFYRRKGQFHKAEDVLRRGVELRPDHRERIESLAHLLHDLGRRDEAETLYERAAALPTREERRATSSSKS